MKKRKYNQVENLPNIDKWKKEEFQNKEFQNYYLNALFISSIISLIHGINIYRLTIIEFKYLFFCVAFGFLFFWFSHLIKFSKYKIKSITLLIYSLVIGGCFSYSVLLYSNYYFATDAYKIGKYKIEHTGTLAKGTKSRCGQPYAEINYAGINKQLMFDCQLEENIDSYLYVELKIRRGFLNFDIVQEKKLLKS